MRAPWRPIEFTRYTPFHAHSDAVYFGIFVERRPEFVFAILVGWCCRVEGIIFILLIKVVVITICDAALTLWYDTRIHEGGQCEIGQHKERDDTLVGGHPRMAEQVVLTSAG